MLLEDTTGRIFLGVSAPFWKRIADDLRRKLSRFNIFPLVSKFLFSSWCTLFGRLQISLSFQPRQPFLSVFECPKSALAALVAMNSPGRSAQPLFGLVFFFSACSSLDPVLDLTSP